MNPWYIAILVITLGFFFWENLLRYLSGKKVDQLPEEVQDVYDDEKYKKSREYSAEKSFFAIWTSTFQLIVFLLFFLLGGFSWLDIQVRAWTELSIFSFVPQFFIEKEILHGLLYIGFLVIASGLLGLPASLYSTFVIEEKYGFNKTTLKTFFRDRIIGLIIGALLGAPLLSLIIWLFGFAANDSLTWLYVLSAVFVIQMVLLYVAPVWIMPLFNKFEPLEDGELKEAINDFAASENFELQGVFKMDGSKRSSKANAFFTGFGKNRRIVLFDTLIESMSTEELVAVLAHEMGHCKKKHISKQLIVSVFSMGLVFYLIQVMLKNPALFEAYQVKDLSIYASLVFIAPLLEPVNYAVSIFTSILSRKYEYEADAYSAEKYGKPEKLVTALKTLSRDNLSNLTPHPLEVFTEYSHPPLKDRIRALQQF